MIFTKETLQAMRAELPSGSQKVIADKLNYSKEYVSRVLCGDATNMEIISEASRIILEARELINQVNKNHKAA